MSARALHTRDAESRLLAQTEFARPLLLRAGAGTGKTQVLIARLVAWCVDRGWSAAERALGPRAVPADVATRVLDRVLAITFTEAAAAEMERRAGAALGALARNEPDHPALFGVALDRLSALESRAARAEALLGSFDALRIRTIHSFCRSLLAEHALEAGLHPAFEVDADQSRAAEVAREVLLEKLRTAFEPVDPDWLALVREGITPADLEDVLLGLLERAVPSAALARDPFAPERVERFAGELRAPLRELAASGQGALLAFRESSRTHKTASSLHKIDAHLESLPREGAAALESWVRGVGELFARNDGDRLEEWAHGKFTRAEGAALGSSSGAFAAAAERLRGPLEHALALRPAALAALRGALAPLLEAGHARLRARGALSYDGLLFETRALLAANAAVVQAVRGRIDQLLVDEFQDTDETQCEILACLALEGRERPGLFAVGDPQQSIYGWRNADLSAYERFQRRLVDEGGEIAELRVNFRSVPSVLSAVHTAIEPILRERKGLQPPFAALVPSALRARERGFQAAPCAPVEYWSASTPEELAGGPALRSSERAVFEARALARDLARLAGSDRAALGEVAVLLRSRGELEVYLEALRTYGVPYSVEGDRDFYRRREVVDAIALVRAVVDPMDQISLCAWLRSPAVGLPDALWLPLAARGLFADLALLRGPDAALLARMERKIRDAAAELEPAEIPGLERIEGFAELAVEGVRTLAELRASFANDAPDLFVEAMRTKTLIEPTEAARFLGAYRLANLERFFRELARDLCEAGGDGGRVLRALRRRERRPLLAEDGRPPEASEGAVRILTVHGAKGLDFEHVYLVGTHQRRPPRSRRTPTERFVVDPDPEYALLGAATLGYHRILAREAEVEAAEAVRLLYVALTRAKRRLVVSFPWRSGAARVRPEDARSLAELLLHRPDLPSERELLHATRFADGSARLDAGGVRFVAHEVGQLGMELGRPAPARMSLAADALRAEQEELASERAYARERMALPFATSVSGKARPAAPASFAARAGPGSEAAAIGSAVHRALETLDLLGEPQASLERAERELARALEQGVPSARREPALRRALELLERFARGPLHQRLRSLAADVVERELPLLAPPGAGAVGYQAGVVDLLYREEGTWVVADYKTDRVEGERDVERLLATYAEAARDYGRAVQSAFRLTDPPRLELWLLDCDRIVWVPFAGGAEPSTLPAR